MLVSARSLLKLGDTFSRKVIHHNLVNSGRTIIRDIQRIQKIKNSFTRTMSSQVPQSSTPMDENGQDQLLRDVFEICMRHLKSTEDRRNPVVKFKTPEELKTLVDFSISGNPEKHEKLKQLCESIAEYSVKTAHPRFFNQQFGGIDKYGLAGDIVVSSLNCNLHTFEVAPAFVMAEKAVIEKTLKLFGYQSGEGTICPGGSYSSMMATNLARYLKCPDTKERGLSGGARLVMFASEQAHYSAVKNAILLGIGTDNCVKVPCDNTGKMIPSELEKGIVKAKNEGAIPFFAISTAATTVLGSFDRFHDIADVCKKYGLWLHVDACWGGAAMFSKKHRHLLDGVERSDSLAWNAHKMGNMPVQCSLFITKHEGLMKKVNALEVPYLFQSHKPYDTKYDVGSNLIMCGRRADSFKLWLAWKANGDERFEKYVDKCLDNAQYLVELVNKRDHFKLVIPKPEFSNVSFWFIPPSLRGQKEDGEYWKKIHSVAATIKDRMQARGSVLVGVQPVGKLVNFFRMTVVNGRAEHEDMEFVLDEIERCGDDL